MFFNTLRAEFTKLLSVRSFWGNTVFYVLMTVGFGALSAFLFSAFSNEQGGPMLMDAKTVAQSMNMGGGLVLAIMSVIMVTNEYAQKYISVTFQAVPNRLIVALAKYVAMSIVAIVFSVLAFAIGVPIVRLIVGAELGPELTLTHEKMLPYLWKTPIYAMMFILLAQGMAWLLRSATAVIVIILGWFMALEPMVLPLLPKWGQKVAPYGPFKNLSAFYYGESIPEVPWDRLGSMACYGSLAYFAAWALVIYIAGIVLLLRRDA
ncbi:hypothetical protein WG936_04665 [Corynebacterium sp. H127]|uniref:hypothetical protein n=1 Tax=Corynebacterium sp. H127 TaxID=3133418 RepID=UPI0030990554